jgi:RNA recognition motif-containing protein
LSFLTGFCFLEFETPEAAFMSLEHMQSVTIGGRAVKVGRLSNIGQAQHFIQQFALEASKYNRVYISNIHSNISDDDIRAVFESFGKVRRKVVHYHFLGR